MLCFTLFANFLAAVWYMLCVYWMGTLFEQQKPGISVPLLPVNRATQLSQAGCSGFKSADQGNDQPIRQGSNGFGKSQFAPLWSRVAAAALSKNQ